MAARQLLPDRGRSPDGTTPPAARLQQEAPAPRARRRQRQRRRTAARLRPRAAGDRARRRPGRPRPADPLRRRVPVEAAAPPRRAVGAADHAAPGADREPAPHRRAGRGRAPRAQHRRGLGRQHGRDRRRLAERPDPGDRRHGALGPAAHQRLRRRVRAPPARAWRRADARAQLDRAAPRRKRPDDRAARPARGAPAGGQPGVGEQQHRQPAPARRDELARLRRVAEQRRADAARRPRRGLRGDGLRHARPLPPRDRGDRRAQPAVGNRDRAARGRARVRSRSRRRDRLRCRPAAGARRLLSPRRGPRPPRARGAREAAEIGRARPSGARTRAAALRGSDLRADAPPRCAPHVRGARRDRMAVVGRIAVRARARARDEPARRLARQLGRHAVRAAAAAAAHGLRQRHRRRVAHAGRGADDARQHRCDRSARRGARGALPRQPRPAPALWAA